MKFAELLILRSLLSLWKSKKSLIIAPISNLNFSMPQERPKEEYKNVKDNIPGFITHIWPNGDKYEGQMLHDEMHGRGIFTCTKRYVYTGEFKHGKPNGLGKLKCDNGDEYEGSFLNDMLHGEGIYSYANGDCYRGEFINDLPHGHGVYILANGKVYSGKWEKGRLTTE